MSEVEERTSGGRPASVTELSEGKRVERAEERPAEPQSDSGSGSRGWKIATFVLLGLLLVSAFLNYQQLGVRGSLESEAAEAADVLATQTRRADSAELAATQLRQVVGDVHANITALQENLAQMLASTGSILEPQAEVTSAEPAQEEPSAFDAVADEAEEALGAMEDAAPEGATAAPSARGEGAEPGEEADVFESAPAVETPKLPEAELPDVSSPPEAALPQAAEADVAGSSLTRAWGNTRSWFADLFGRGQ